MSYQPAMKYWDHAGNVIPDVHKSEGILPAIEVIPAPWLPLNEAGGIHSKNTEEYFSILPGKPVALTRDGHVVPAGLLIKWRAAGNSDICLQYTETDLAEGVKSLKTGVAVATSDVTANGSTGWRKSDLATALKARGLLKDSEGLEDFVSAPIGVAPYPYFNAFATDPNNPATLRKHNFQLQTTVAVLCDYVLSIPHVPEHKTSLNSDTADLGRLVSYAATVPNVWYFEFTGETYTPIAGDNGLTTKWTFDDDTHSLFVNRKVRPRDVKSTGDYMVDDSLQRLYFYHGGASTAAVGTDTTDIPVVFNMYHYNSTSDNWYSKKYAGVMGNVKEGDYLIPTAKSNWMPVTKANAHFDLSTSVGTGSVTVAFGVGYDQAEHTALVEELKTALAAINTINSELETNAREQALILGQVLTFETYPRQGLEHVRSYGDRLPASQINDRMPGSATHGIDDKIIRAGGANRNVIINIIKK
jgi:hypothetical protein